jgi:hypothetical protein
LGAGRYGEYISKVEILWARDCMSLINRASVKRSALDMANAKFKERNKTRLEMGLAPTKSAPSRVSSEFIDTFEAKVIGLLSIMVHEHKSGATL